MSYAFAPLVRSLVAGSDRRIVVTGAGGWLGLATLELLADALGDGLADRVRCFGHSQRTLTLLGGQQIEQRPLADLGAIDPAPTLLLHLAFLTKDRAEQMDEATYRLANRSLTGIVLDHLDSIGTIAAFVASSGAARFADDPAKPAALRLYGELKRADEQAFAAWAQDSGKRAVITRIFNVSGPHMNKLESYALSSFILAAMNGDPVTVRAPHRVLRGYVAIRELMSLVFAELLRDEPGVVEFESGGDPMELAEVAGIVARDFGSTAGRAPVTSDAADEYLGDADAYRALLDRHGIDPVPMAGQVAETRRDIERRTAARIGAGSA